MAVEILEDKQRHARLRLDALLHYKTMLDNAITVQLDELRAIAAQIYENSKPKLKPACIACANGNDLPMNETCAVCGREGPRYP